MSGQDTLPALPEQDGIEFRHIPGFPGYCSGSDGSVWSCWVRHPHRMVPDKWRGLKGFLDKEGYHVVAVRCEKRAFNRRVAALVLSAFVSPRPEGMQACHGDGDKSNNRLSNLRWDLPAGNYADRDRHGTTARGERVGNSKLVAEQVREIRRLATAKVTHNEIGRRFGVSKALVGKIVYRKCWTHVA